MKDPAKLHKALLDAGYPVTGVRLDDGRPEIMFENGATDRQRADAAAMAANFDFDVQAPDRVKLDQFLVDQTPTSATQLEILKILARRMG